jgi:prepilin-type N-terminal cleavage/methylation domain-containing protein
MKGIKGGNKMLNLLRKAKNQKGFTLVELMVVVVIIGILVAIAVPLYNNVTANARKNSCFANQRTIEGALAMYASENGDYPDNINKLEGEYLQAIPVCPDGGTYNFDGTGEGDDATVNRAKVVCSEHGHYTGVESGED